MLYFVHKYQRENTPPTVLTVVWMQPTQGKSRKPRNDLSATLLTSRTEMWLYLLGTAEATMDCPENLACKLGWKSQGCSLIFNTHETLFVSATVFPRGMTKTKTLPKAEPCLKLAKSKELTSLLGAISPAHRHPPYHQCSHQHHKSKLLFKGINF